MDIVERLLMSFSPTRDLKSTENNKLHKDAADEIERLRKANKRLGEIATDAVEWLPPASVNGPHEKYQNEIKELTDGHC